MLGGCDFIPGRLSRAGRHLPSRRPEISTRSQRGQVTVEPPPWSMIMRRCAPLVLAAGFLVAADDPKDELKKLEGTYKMVSSEEKGKKLPDETVKDATLKIAGDKHTAKVGNVTIVGIHKVDPTKKPAEIDASDTEGPFKGMTRLGIYKLEGDLFTFCFPLPGKDRPVQFSTTSGTGHVLVVWKKEKK